MKLRIVIDPNRDEEIIIYAHEKSPLVCEVEELVKNYSVDLIGYTENETVKLNLNDVYCFFTEDNKVYAMLEKEKWNLKQRLYALEGMLGGDFVKINQSCIANVRMIEKFDVSFGGGLLVIFKNGHRDYVSRRQMKAVKEKIGI